MALPLVQEQNQHNGDYGSIAPSSPGEDVESSALIRLQHIDGSSVVDHQRQVWRLLRTNRAGAMILLMLVVLAFQAIRHDALGTNSQPPLSPPTAPNLIAEISLLSSTASDDETKQRHHDPTEPLYFQQIVDHNREGYDFFAQRYYVNFDYWKGPGHPIFFIFGGEGPLERILYPSVSEILAERFGAVTFNVEHRYFGESYPMKNPSKKDIAQQLTPRQALQDIVYFLQEQQKRLGCGPRNSSTYCPVMAVGGSYAGLLSTLIRSSYPDVVDMAYSASPCLLLFSHQVSPYVYYEYVTQVAERISHGCPDAVKTALNDIQTDLEPITSRDQLQSMAQDYGICSELPQDVQTGSDLSQQLISYTAAQFISTNMDYYPPGTDQKFFQGCTIFQEPNQSTAERMRKYIAMIRDGTENESCYKLGPTEEDADYWDALCCYLVPQIGKSNDTMWPAHMYDLESDIQNCQDNFGIMADPQYLEKEFGWNSKGGLSGVTRLILTNGYNDGWFPLSYTNPILDRDGNVNDGVVILNMENGAHHSDLTHQLQADTPDVAEVHTEIALLISQWLEEIRHES